LWAGFGHANGLAENNALAGLAGGISPRYAAVWYGASRPNAAYESRDGEGFA